MLLAGSVSPSVARVRIVDLLGLAGAITSGGLYLAFAGNIEPRIIEGLAAGGAALGLATGWLLTSGMQKQEPIKDPSVVARSQREPNPPSATPTPTTITATPMLRMVSGGATLGMGGAF
jgi:hypothetical protein